MANEPLEIVPANQTLLPAQVYAMAAVCLLLGLGLGYLARGLQTGANGAVSPAQIVQSAEGLAPMRVPAPASAILPGPATINPHLPANGALPTTVLPGRSAAPAPSPAQLRRLADNQVAPLIRKAENDPKNPALPAQIGAIYHIAQQFNEASNWYRKAILLDPRNSGLRTRLASSLYRGGDVDGALAQLDAALRIDPKDANSLFDLGLIRLQGKGDIGGALAAWQKLLKANPAMSSERRTAVENMIAQAEAMKSGHKSIGGTGHGAR